MLEIERADNKRDSRQNVPTQRVMSLVHNGKAFFNEVHGHADVIVVAARAIQAPKCGANKRVSHARLTNRGGVMAKRREEQIWCTPGQVDITGIFSRAAGNLNELARKASVAIRLTSEETSYSIWADELLVLHIITETLGEAIAATPGGIVELTSRISDDGGLELIVIGGWFENLENNLKSITMRKETYDNPGPNSLEGICSRWMLVAEIMEMHHGRLSKTLSGENPIILKTILWFPPSLRLPNITYRP